jgi:type III secretion protein V
MQGESSSNMVIQVGSAIFAAIDPVTFTAIRDEAMDRIFAKTGLRLPSFGIQPDASLPPDRVCIMLDGVSGFEATVDPACVIAVADEDILKLNGLAVLPLENKWGVRHGHWIEDRDKAVLASAGVKVFGLAQLLAQTGGRFITRNTRHIVGYKHVQTIIRELGSEHESLASQVSQTISAVQLLNLIRKLLAEGVPLLPRRILFEALLEASVTAVGSEHMVRSARSALARQISASLAGEGNVIAGYVLEPDLELALRETIVRGADENSLAPGPVLAASLLEQARMLLARHEIGSPAPVILVVDELRWPLSALLRSKGIEVSVLAFHEIGAEFTFAPVGTISLELNAAGGTARDMAA